MNPEKEILALRAELHDLKRELAELKQRLGLQGDVDTRSRAEKKVDTVIAVMKNHAAVVESWMHDGA